MEAMGNRAYDLDQTRSKYRAMFRLIRPVTAAIALAFASHPIAAQTASTGCANPSLASGSYDITDQGITRRFRVHMPRGIDSNTPKQLILTFHSWGGTEDTLLDNRIVRRQANTAGAIIVSPVGLGQNEDRPASWSTLGTASGLDGDGINPLIPDDTAATCNFAVLNDETYPSCGPVGAGTAQNICSWTHCQANDLQFVNALITHIEQQACVDQGRIFATGVSNGGLFVWGIGQDEKLAPRLAGIASLVGLPHRGYLDGPGGGADLPALLITGTDDPIMPPGDWEEPGFTTSQDGEEFYYTGATAITRVWADALSCETNTAPAPIDVNNRQFDCRSYCAVPEGQTLPPVLDCRHDHGHGALMRQSWPLIMEFFADQ